MASKTYTQATTTAEFFAGVARSLNGTKEGEYRTTHFTEHYANDPEQIGADYYKRKVLEQRIGNFKPTPMRSFAAAVSHFERFLAERIGPNIAKWRKEQAAGNLEVAGISLVPFIYKVPHPTQEERDAYMERWNNDGDLFLKFNAMCDGLPVGLLPQIIHGDKPQHSLMMSVLMLIDADDL